MHVKKEQLHSLIRHELAHYMTFINHGALLYPHGVEFKAFCQRMGWGEEVSRANMCIEEVEGVQALEESAILRKVQKLMALGTSSNTREAELAMIKSRELDNLWHQVERERVVRGLVAKNSFFYEIAKGYCDKVQALKKEYTQEVSTALMVIEKKLMERQAMVYPRLTSHRCSGQHCQESSRLGEQMGKTSVSIRPFVKLQKLQNCFF